MTDPRAHADHDPELVAAYAAGDAAGAGLAEAEALVAGCAECALLHRDLRAIASALAAAPAPARPRDFRVPPDRAAALRRPAGLRGLLAPLASRRLSLAGPAAASLAALGVAGLLLSGGLGPGAGTASLALATAAPAAADAVGGGAGAAAPGAGSGTDAAGATPAGGAPSPATDFSSGLGPTLALPTTGLVPVATATPSPVPTAGPAATRSDAGPSAAPLIDQARAVAIARAASPADAREKVLAVQLRTFGEVGNPYAPTNGPRPADGTPVWIVNLGEQLAPLNGGGTIVIIDAADGHVIQSYSWIS